MIGFGFKILFAVILLIVGKYIIGAVRRLTAKAFARSNADTGVSQFTDSIIKYGLYTVLVILVVTSFGVNLSSITAILAAAGVADPRRPPPPGPRPPTPGSDPDTEALCCG